MAQEFAQLSAFFDHGYDAVIDVRSPAEFGVDHIPGAINLPALNDVERAQVGTIYKQVSPFDARKIGAALVIRNVAAHLEGPLAGQGGAWRPLVYCWRGGQRSGVFASLLAEIGWRAETVKGGYTSFRRQVKAAVYDAVLAHRIVLLDGNTGTAKTDILGHLHKAGVQVIDLEGLARHRGSLLGGLPGGQPAQKAFETALALALHRCDPEKPVVIEAESSKIGRINLPQSLWQAMQRAPRILLAAPVPARATYLAAAYRSVLEDTGALAEKLQPLRRLRGHAVVDGWLALSRAGALTELAAALITQHYDPAYQKPGRGEKPAPMAQITLDDLSPQAQAGAAAQIIKALNAW